MSRKTLHCSRGAKAEWHTFTLPELSILEQQKKIKYFPTQKVINSHIRKLDIKAIFTDKEELITD